MKPRGRTLSSLVVIVVFVSVALPFVRAVPPSSVEPHRVKDYPGLKDENVAYSVDTYPPVSYSGYFSVNKTYGANLFYWFFETQTGVPESTPTILWLQGGPGCPSLLGCMVEMGPFYVTDDLQLERNNNSWNTLYNMLFIDQPAGVGFSNISNPEGYVMNEEEMANELYSALVQFFEAFPQYQKNDFYIFGESYGGKYVPSIAYKILQENAIADSLFINLVGIGIGDGLTDPLVQVTGYAPYAYSFGLIDSKQLEDINNLTAIAIETIQREDWNKAWEAYGQVWQRILAYAGNPNPLDIRTYVEYDFSPVQRYFNQPSVRAALNVGNNTYKGNSCNDPAGAELNPDIAKSVKSLFPELLDNINVLLYNGQFDLEVALTTSEAWIATIPWSGQEGYLNATRVVWRNTMTNETAGMVRNYQRLTQIIVVGAGHMVPLNQPENALDMVSRFINGFGWL